MTAGSKIDVLKKIPFFSDMSDYDLHQIGQITVEKDYRAGDVIIRENTSAARFFVIDHGKVEITKKFEDGEEMVLGVHSDGEFFGEIALLDEGPRSATARALKPTTVLEISRHDFETLLYTAPVLAYTMMKELSSRLRETGALLVSHLQRKNRQLSQAYLETVTLIIHTIEERNSYTRGHTRRATVLAKAIGREMGLIDEELFSLEIGTLLHDLGKISVPDSILLKPGPLEHEEYERVKEHPQKGKEMIEGIAYLERVVPYVFYHHERFDGTGYPRKLAGSEIPLAGRIIAVADVFDAITHDRAYRKGRSFDDASAEIQKNAGKQFDPAVVEAFLKAWKDKRLADLLQEGEE